jgi:hypothetical protein
MFAELERHEIERVAEIVAMFEVAAA